MLYISLLDDYLQHGPFDTTFLALKKQELFYLLFNCYSQDELSMLFHPLLGEDLIFKEFIQTHFLKVRSVNELASLAHYSTSGFIKRFRRCFNESPYRWIARKKSERICSDIISGRLSFQEIAYQYKFSSYARFVDFCKTQIGFLPSEISEGKHSLLQQKNILKEN